MKNAFREIHERSLWQVLTLYVAASWAVIEVSQTLSEGLQLPDWIVPFAVILLLIGLPIVLSTAVIHRGLSSRGPESPPQSLADVGDVPPLPAEPLPPAARLLTWKRALLGGAAGFGLLAVVTLAWVVTRSLGIGPAGTLVSRGVLEERDVILLADFGGSTDDPMLADVVTEVVRVDLSQSEAVRLADDAFVDAALDRMQRPPDTRLTEELVREIGQREGLKAYVAGDVARAGTGFTLTARVMEPVDGAVLISHRETARDSTELVDAIDRLSSRIRERIGDPLGSLAASLPLAQVTTRNLEALRRFTASTRLPDADAERIIRLLEEAVALDSTFAMAWRALGITLRNYGTQPGRAAEANTRAFLLRDHLTPVERDRVSALYYLSVSNEPRRAIPFFEAALERDPANTAPLTNIGEAYRDLGDLETALAWYDRVLEVDSMQSIALMNIAQVRATAGDLEGSLAAAELLGRRGHAPFDSWHRAMALDVGRRWAEAESTMAVTRDAVRGSPFLLAATTSWLAGVVGSRGRIAEFEAHWATVVRLNDEDGVSAEALRSSIPAAITGPLVLGRSDRTRLDEALRRFPLDEIAPIERPYLDLADAYALMGFPEEAQRLADAFDAAMPASFARGQRFYRHRTQGNIHAAAGRYANAIEGYRQAFSRPQDIEPAVLMARAFDAAGEPDSARVYYRRYVDSTYWLRAIRDPLYLGPAMERLAELELEAGHLTEARAYYAAFVELWSGADADLQPRVEAAQARIQEITDAIG